MGDKTGFTGFASPSKLPEARFENGAVPSDYFGAWGADATTDRLNMSVLSWHAADVEQKFPAPTTFKYTTLTLDKAATFYDKMYATYLANEPWSQNCEGACNSRSHKVAFEHFPGIQGEDLRDAELKKKRRADQAAGKEQRVADVLDARAKQAKYGAAREERLRCLVGKRVRVFWPKDDQYYAGVVTAYTEKNRVFHHTIHYDDDQTETLNLAKQTWHEIDDDASDSEPDAPPAKKPKGLREERIEALKEKGPDPW